MALSLFRFYIPEAAGKSSKGTLKIILEGSRVVAAYLHGHYRGCHVISLKSMYVVDSADGDLWD